MSTGPHRVAFRGSVDSGPLVVGERDIAVLDASGAAHVPEPAGIHIVELTYPPTRVAAESIAELIGRHGPERVFGVGDGATLDVVKQAWLAAQPRPELVLAPLGAEPWRAFAPFTSLYEPDGQRVSRPDPALATARVIVNPAVLADRTGTVAALHRADTAVHAVEVLLSTRTSGWSRALARAGLSNLDTGVPGDDVVGAGLVTEAFASTGLGLAHAVASPLGARACRTHDMFNVLIAPFVVRHWADRVDWTAVATGLRIAPSAAAVAEALEDRRARSAVPASLREAGLGRDEALAVVPLAMRSSGIPWLPVLTSAEDVTRLVERAWAGD